MTFDQQLKETIDHTIGDLKNCYHLDNDRSFVIIAVSLLDNVLRGYIKSLIVEDKNLTKNVFRTNALLGSLNNMIDFSFSVGMLSKQE